MTNLNQILIVAPDRGFRQSLEFALEVEGFKIASYSTLEAASATLQTAASACAVIDETALKKGPTSWNTLQNGPIPIILLVDRAHPFPEVDYVRFLIKPVFGNALITEIRKLIGGEADN